MEIRGTVAYVEQEPFIISGTIRDNILFGKEYNERRLNQCLRVSQLEKDMDLFSKGIETTIGERGINISGG